MKDEDSESQLLLIMIGFLAYLSLPILFGSALYVSLTLGAFPPELDLIAIPLAGFFMLWTCGLFVAFVWGAIHVVSGLPKKRS